MANIGAFPDSIFDRIPPEGNNQNTQEDPLGFHSHMILGAWPPDQSVPSSTELAKESILA
jgi:hypothetical protein